MGDVLTFFSEICTGKKKKKIYIGEFREKKRQNVTRRCKALGINNLQGDVFKTKTSRNVTLSPVAGFACGSRTGAGWRTDGPLICLNF
jgi:hypothetical protein